MADANGLMSGDRGYDQNTEQGDPSSGSSDGMGWLGKGGDKDKEVDYSEFATAPIAMPAIDFSRAPAWWNKEGSALNEPITQLPTSPQTQQAPIMLDVLGNVGGSTGITGQQAMSSALRNGG